VEIMLAGMGMEEVITDLDPKWPTLLNKLVAPLLSITCFIAKRILFVGVSVPGNGL